MPTTPLACLNAQRRDLDVRRLLPQRKGKLASFSMRNGSDGVEEDERSKIKANLESALISQEDGKFTQGEGQTPRHEAFIPTIVKRQFAR